MLNRLQYLVSPPAKFPLAVRLIPASNEATRAAQAAQGGSFTPFFLADFSLALVSGDASSEPASATTQNSTRTLVRARSSFRRFMVSDGFCWQGQPSCVSLVMEVTDESNLVQPCVPTC